MLRGWSISLVGVLSYYHDLMVCMLKTWVNRSEPYFYHFALP